MSEKEFLEELEKIGVYPTKNQLSQLEKYYNLLVEWNEKINLTRIIEKKDVYLKHFYDSLTIVKTVNLETINNLCDVGTGAGFPGIVLKIMYPHINITLLDSLQKRINFLNVVINTLNLKDIKTIHTRSEDYRGQYDIVVSRAVANIEKLLEITMHLVKPSGMLVAMKGNIDKELTPIIKTKIEKKYVIEKIEKFFLPIEKSSRSIIIVKNK